MRNHAARMRNSQLQIIPAYWRVDIIVNVVRLISWLVQFCATQATYILRLLLQSLIIHLAVNYELSGLVDIFSLFSWPMQRAVEYLMNNTLLSNATCWGQIKRYVSWPGQACSYKIGELKIREIRDEAIAKLGELDPPLISVLVTIATKIVWVNN